MTIIKFPSDATPELKRGVQANVYYWGDRCDRAEAEIERLRTDVSHYRKVLAWYAGATLTDFANDRGFNATAALECANEQITGENTK